MRQHSLQSLFLLTAVCGTAIAIVRSGLMPTVDGDSVAMLAVLAVPLGSIAGLLTGLLHAHPGRSAGLGFCVGAMAGGWTAAAVFCRSDVLPVLIGSALIVGFGLRQIWTTPLRRKTEGDGAAEIVTPELVEEID